MNRRLFIKDTGRWMILLSLMAFIGFLGWRKKIAPSSACPDNTYCDKCKSAGDCRLPKRQRFLINEKEKRD